MKNKEVKSGNLVISDFIGLQLNGQEPHKYHLSWDHLMLVVKRIMQFDLRHFNHDVSSMRMMRHFKVQLMELSITSDINVVWRLVVSICEWVANNKKTVKIATNK